MKDNLYKINTLKLRQDYAQLQLTRLQDEAISAHYNYSKTVVLHLHKQNKNLYELDNNYCIKDML